MDLSFLYGWEGYYVLQGFWLDVRALVAHASMTAVICCFAVLLAVLLLIERKSLRVGSLLYVFFAALYGTFLLTVTVLGRETGNISAWDQLFLTYRRAFDGSASAERDILYNVVLYIPVGLLMSRYRNVKLDVIILAALPTAIEFAQLLTTRGVFEITDILNNFIGGVIGLGTARLIALLFRWIHEKRKGGRVERAERTHRNHRFTTE